MATQKKATKTRTPAAKRNRNRPTSSREPSGTHRAGSGADQVHLLDVGEGQYGDCALCVLGGRTFLIDGGHPADLKGSASHKSIPDQLRQLLGVPEGEMQIDLLIISHAHNDHIGCLPEMVTQGMLKARYALLVPPSLGWGRAAGDRVPPPGDSPADLLMAMIREEPQTAITDSETFRRVALDVAQLESRYTQMIARLRADGTRVVEHGLDTRGLSELEEAFSAIHFKVLGPTLEHMQAAAAEIAEQGRDFFDIFEGVPPDSDALAVYREFVASATDLVDGWKGPEPAINLQSSVWACAAGDGTILFTGDMQFEDPQVNSAALRQNVADLSARVQAEGPYSFVKIAHHGSTNAFGPQSNGVLGNTHYFRISTGSGSTRHPYPETLELVRETGATRARTNHNGPVTITFERGTAHPRFDAARRSR